MPAGPGSTLGHEVAGEIVELGADVTGLQVGDHVVVNPQAAPSGIIGCGGALGGMREYLIIENAVAGQSLAVIPDAMPYEVAALNEPLAFAMHCVNRSEAGSSDNVVVFGAGPIGLGVTIWLKLRGVQHVTVVDIIPTRLQTPYSTPPWRQRNGAPSWSWWPSRRSPKSTSPQCSAAS